MDWIIYIFSAIIVLLVLMYTYKGGYSEGYKDGSKDSLNNIIKFSELMMNIGKPNENATNTQKVASQN